jgi:methionine biosynthesis protein MetW
VIADMIPQGSRVLDIGCGDGALLAWLSAHKGVDARGMELSRAGVTSAIARGLSVIQGDADLDLAHYADQSYDCAILSQTLQTMRDPKGALAHLARIGRQAIVSVPNFGYWRNRLYLWWHGRMPVTKTLSYSWYDTPNIHFCTLRDFVELCEEMHIRILKRLFVNHKGLPQRFQGKAMSANFFGEQGIFLLENAGARFERNQAS